jgi:hypothetical protein
MSKKLYVLFLHLDAAYMQGIYENEAKAKAALAEVQSQLDFDLEEDMYEILDVELNEGINYIVAEYDDLDDEEYEDDEEDAPVKK